jgi:hypothetical protein
MKYLIPIVFLLVGCSGGVEPITETSTNPVDIFTAAGITDVTLTQTDGVALTPQLASIEGTSFVIYLDGCKLSYDVAAKDPVNHLFWLSQSVTVWFDTSTMVCNVPRSCSVGTVEIIGTTVEAGFTC